MDTHDVVVPGIWQGHKCLGNSVVRFRGSRLKQLLPLSERDNLIALAMQHKQRAVDFGNAFDRGIAVDKQQIDRQPAVVVSPRINE